VGAITKSPELDLSAERRMISRIEAASKLFANREQPSRGAVGMGVNAMGCR
jgi:hypothetical protein